MAVDLGSITVLIPLIREEPPTFVIYEGQSGDVDRVEVERAGLPPMGTGVSAACPAWMLQEAMINAGILTRLVEYKGDGEQWAFSAPS